jgi:hypothetical protein
MPANTLPIFTKIADVQWITGASVNNTYDLTSGTIYLAFSADSTNGGYIQRIRFKALGTTAATVARVFINNGSTTNTITNNILWDEISLPLVSASATAASATYELPMNIPLPAGYKIYVVFGTAASAGWGITVIGGKY